MPLWSRCRPAEPEYVAGDYSSMTLMAERWSKDEGKRDACVGTAGLWGFVTGGRRSGCNKKEAERCGGGCVILHEFTVPYSVIKRGQQLQKEFQ